MKEIVSDATDVHKKRRIASRKNAALKDELAVANELLLRRALIEKPLLPRRRDRPHIAEGQVVR